MTHRAKHDVASEADIYKGVLTDLDFYSCPTGDMYYHEVYRSTEHSACQDSTLSYTEKRGEGWRV